MLNIPIKKNDEFDLHIEDLTSEGAGVGKIGGFAVFVGGALPGEGVRVRAVKVNKSYAFGKLLAVIEPSVYRVDSFCALAGRCGGCPLAGMSYEGQLLFKRKRVMDALQRIGGFAALDIADIEGGAEVGYRNKASFPVRSVGGKPKIGFFAKGSHRLIPLDSCPINEFDSKPIIDTVLAYMEEKGIAAYDEERHCGLFRHLLIRSGAEGLLICAVINGKRLPDEDALAARLLAVQGVSGVCVNINREKGNAVLGELTRCIGGVGSVTVNRLKVGADSFFQVNAKMAERLNAAAIAAASPKPGDTVFDIYCGVGAVGFAFAGYVKRVYGVETAKAAIENAKQNAVLNKIENAEFICAGADEGISGLLEKGVKPDIVILDPPRAGCGPSALAAVIKAAPRKIVYISCDPATLARDLKILAAYNYEIKSVKPIDMFPQTAHVETAVVMEPR